MSPAFEGFIADLLFAAFVLWCLLRLCKIWKPAGINSLAAGSAAPPRTLPARPPGSCRPSPSDP